jgi:hypothetical protein
MVTGYEPGLAGMEMGRLFMEELWRQIFIY